MAGRETGVDIIARGKDEATKPLGMVQSALKRLDTAIKDNRASMGRLSTSFELLRGGAAIAGVTAVARGFSDMLVKVNQIVSGTGVVNRTWAGTAREVAGLIPVFGQIVELGAQGGDAIVEMVTQQNRLAAEAGAVARAYQTQIDTLNAFIAAQRVAIDNHHETLQAMQDENTILRRILARGQENEAAIRQQYRAWRELRDADQQRIRELLAQNQQYERGLQILIEQGAAAEVIAEYQRQAAEARRQLEIQWARELEALRERRRLEEEIRQAREEERRREEAERRRAEGERRQQREAEERQREAERARQDALRDEERRRSALRQAESRLGGAEESRFLSGRAAAFRSARTSTRDAAADEVRGLRDILHPVLRDVIRELRELRKNKPYIATI